MKHATHAVSIILPVDLLGFNLVYYRYLHIIIKVMSCLHKYDIFDSEYFCLTTHPLMFDHRICIVLLQVSVRL